MTVKLTQLSIENFRGVRSISIPLEKRSLVLVGENGSGKSAIVDALEYLFTGKIERLKRQDVREKQCIPFVGAKDKDVRIELRTTQGSLKVGYPYEEPLVQDKGLSEWFNLAKARPFILRRAQILKFVEATGADRYRQISLLIGLEQLDEIEKAWRELANECENRKREAERRASEAEQSLCRLAGVERVDEALVVASINQRLREFSLLGIQPISTIAELQSLREVLQASRQVMEAAQKASRMVSLCEGLRTLEKTAKNLINSYGEFYAKWREFAQARETLKEALFRLLLEQGEKLLSQYPEIDGCPLCGTPISREVLLERIRHRLKELADIQQRERKLEEMLASLREKVAEIVKEVKGAIKNPEVDEDLLERLKQVEAGLPEVRARLNQKVIGGTFPRPEELREISAIRVIFQEIPSYADKIEKRAFDLQPSEIERQQIEMSVWLERLEGAWKDWIGARRKQEQVNKAYEQVVKVYEAIKNARENRLKEIHARIEERVNDYYQRLHPQEGCEVRLPLETRGGVGLRTRFHFVEDSHPLGFYSEGHLDTLGIVIFLAFIKEFNRDDSGKPLGLIVLDDVLTTVDSGHRQRVANLLCEEFYDHQVLITTHDRLWAEMLLTTMRSNGIQCLPLHLMPWDVKVGVSYKEFLMAYWEEYRNQAKSNVPPAVAATGRDLEKFLWHMRYNLHLSVPARAEDQYTIGDLYDPFFSWFNSHSVDRPDLPKGFDYELEEIKGKLDGYWRQRNWAGAHYNQWGENLTSKEAEEFISLVERLVKLFQCPRCNSLVEYDDNCGALVCRRCKGKPDGALWRVVKKKK